MNRARFLRFFLAILGGFGIGLGVALGVFSSLAVASFAVGFFGSLFIMLATFYSHYHRVLEASKHEECVILEEMKARRKEDPYELFEEEEAQESPAPEIAPDEEITRETLKRWKPQGRFSLEGLRLGARLSLSLYRLIAYALLIGGVFYLIRHEILHAPALALGIFSVSVSLLGALWMERNR